MGIRADNNDGSCREILTGKHQGKWRVQMTLETPTGAKDRISRVFRTKTEAKKFLQAARRGDRFDPARQIHELTLSEWFEWLAENDWPETLASNTIAFRRSRFKKYVEQHLGHKRLSRIDPMHVRAFYRHLRDNGATPTLVEAVKGDLVRAFNQAVTPYQRVPATLANPFRLPIPARTPRNAVALSPQQVKKAIAHSSLSSNQRTMLGLFLLAGLRLGEVMAITRGQLRFESDLIVVDRAVRVEFGGEQHVRLPKGDKTRNAVMCRTLKSILLDHSRHLEEDDLLFPAASENKPRMKKLVYATWRTIKKAAKLPDDMSPHDCRLTHINIIEKLMPEVSTTTLKEHVGHAATGVTEANYTRPLTDAQALLRDSLERHLGLAHQRSGTPNS